MISDIDKIDEKLKCKDNDLYRIKFWGEKFFHW